MTTRLFRVRSSRWLGLAVAGCLLGSLAAYGQSGADPTALSDASAYRSGVLAYRQGDYDRALPALQDALRQQPQNANIHYYLAIVLDKLSRGDEAVTHYEFVSRVGQEDRVVAYARQRALVLGAPQRQQRAANEPILATQQAALATAKPSVRVPLQPYQSALMVEALLNNRVRGNFIVDTGATYTSISQEMAEQLGDSITPIGTVRITTANGRIEARKVLIAHINVNGVEAHDVEATVIDVRPGSSFSGLLGLSFIRQFRLTIDPQEGLLVFQPR